MRPFILHTLLLIACVVSACHSLEVGENYAIRADDQDWLNSLFYLPATPRVRKEYRMLSDDERRKFHSAIIKMKQDRVSKEELLTKTFTYINTPHNQVRVCYCRHCFDWRLKVSF